MNALYTFELEDLSIICMEIYAKEANKSVLILEKVGAGGQLNNINKYFFKKEYV